MTDSKEMKTLEQQLLDAQQKLARQTQTLELKISRLQTKITKQDVRKSKFINQALEQWQMDSTKFAEEYQRRLEDVLPTNNDRELFGFDPLPEQEEKEQEKEQKPKTLNEQMTEMNPY